LKKIKSLYYVEMLYELVILAAGLYVGKHYPEYVPIPKISKERTDQILNYLKNLQKPEKSEELKSGGID